MPSKSESWNVTYFNLGFAYDFKSGKWYVDMYIFKENNRALSLFAVKGFTEIFACLSIILGS